MHDGGEALQHLTQAKGATDIVYAMLKQLEEYVKKAKRMENGLPNEGWAPEYTLISKMGVDDTVRGEEAMGTALKLAQEKYGTGKQPMDESEIAVISKAIRRNITIHRWSDRGGKYEETKYKPRNKPNQQGPIQVIVGKANGVSGDTRYEGLGKLPNCDASRVIEYATAACGRGTKGAKHAPTSGRRVQQKEQHEGNQWFEHTTGLSAPNPPKEKKKSSNSQNPTGGYRLPQSMLPPAGPEHNTLTREVYLDPTVIADYLKMTNVANNNNKWALLSPQNCTDLLQTEAEANAIAKVRRIVGKKHLGAPGAINAIDFGKIRQFWK